MSSRGFGSGLGIPLSLANGGTGQASGAWISSAVAVTAVTGTGFVASGTVAYFKLGRTFMFRATATVTTASLGAGGVLVALPAGFVSAGGAGGGGRNSTTGLQFAWDLAAGGTNLVLTRYDNAFPAADGSVFNFSGVFESTT